MTDKFKSLFTADKDWWNNACLNYTDDAIDAYIEGYKLAADQLVKRINETGEDQDCLIFPIVFLYRQHLELLLKNIINTGQQLLGKNDKSFAHGHELDKLWSKVKPIVEKAWNEKILKEFKFIEHVINEIIVVDKKSMAFRYSTDIWGKTHLSEFTQINIRNLAEIINKVSDYLESYNVSIFQLLLEKKQAQSFAKKTGFFDDLADEPNLYEDYR